MVRESCWRRGLVCWACMMRRNRGEELGRVPVVEATAGAKAMCHRDSPTRDGREPHDCRSNNNESQCLPSMC